MKNKYIDLIEQSFDFPQDEFKVVDNNLLFNNIPLMDVIKEFGTPLKITYLPKIKGKIRRSRKWFANAFKKYRYKGNYHYSYCTKSSHFSFVMNEVLNAKAHLETSSSFDLELIKKLDDEKRINKDNYIICNGFKSVDYMRNLLDLKEKGFNNLIPILDSMEELEVYKSAKGPLQVGLRIAAEEEPQFEFYTSRLGIRFIDVIPFYITKLKKQKNLKVKMLHFFIDTGIKDVNYYWTEFHKALDLYCALKKICPSLDSLNIGGGMPVKHSLGFDFDYQYMIDEIVNQIKSTCKEEGIKEPDIFTEFGSFTVGESAANIYSVIGQKQQNDRERWYMIDNSLITTLPDIWGQNHRYILLPVNQWDNKFRRVNIGGMSCDIMDYYSSEAHVNEVYMPEVPKGEKLYIGFFHTGAYQESISGYGGIKHCLIPSPKHVLIDKVKGKFKFEVFAEQQKPEQMMEILGY